MVPLPIMHIFKKMSLKQEDIRHSKTNLKGAWSKSVLKISFQYLMFKMLYLVFCFKILICCRVKKCRSHNSMLCQQGSCHHFVYVCSIYQYKFCFKQFVLLVVRYEHKQTVYSVCQIQTCIFYSAFDMQTKTWPQLCLYNKEL